MATQTPEREQLEKVPFDEFPVSGLRLAKTGKEATQKKTITAGILQVSGMVHPLERIK